MGSLDAYKDEILAQTEELKLINERGDIISRDKTMTRIVFTEITKSSAANFVVC